MIGADGVHVGVVDRVEGNRIKLTRCDDMAVRSDHHHSIETGFVAGVEEQKGAKRFCRTPPRRRCPYGNLAETSPDLG